MAWKKTGRIVAELRATTITDSEIVFPAGSIKESD